MGLAPLPCPGNRAKQAAPEHSLWFGCRFHGVQFSLMLAEGNWGADRHLLTGSPAPVLGHCVDFLGRLQMLGTDCFHETNFLWTPQSGLILVVMFHFLVKDETLRQTMQTAFCDCVFSRQSSPRIHLMHEMCCNLLDSERVEGVCETISCPLTHLFWNSVSGFSMGLSWSSLAMPSSDERHSPPLPPSRGLPFLVHCYFALQQHRSWSDWDAALLVVKSMLSHLDSWS